jgi:predicted 2-oxoglutarate/Fe(II)-dependent dioxygenase YbiX
VIEYWDAGEKLADNVATSARGNDQTYGAMKKRDDVIVADIELFNALKARIVRRVVPAVQKAFQFRIFSLEVIRIGCYDSADGGYFRRHRDNRTPYTAHRQFALSLNLNTGDYAGGELRFGEYGRQLYAPGRGGAVIFSCSLLHEALPVTSGRRFAIFSFLCDEAGAAAERKLIAAEQAAGREGVTMRSSGR